ncbi:hypothetical protein QFC21_000956 [Naganishia friedmannii]|uniref:Uncharacterized protein n=1 Tax=Naganishia friedmannii TaxID=89922 RepID=A0ACC2W9H5_9TREE|nr:hypothetical protein QFC21_000956 [Naganishia friedmannii]
MHPITEIPTHPIQAEVQQQQQWQPPQPNLNNIHHHVSSVPLPQQEQHLPLTRPAVSVVDTESRGIKRKLAGWTAPSDHHPYPPVQPQPHHQQQPPPLAQFHAHPTRRESYNTILPEMDILALPLQVNMQENDIKPALPALAPSPPSPHPETTIKSEPSPPPPPPPSTLDLPSSSSPSSSSPSTVLPPVLPPVAAVADPIKKYARMGTRVPGSGDLGGSGTRMKRWPRCSGVRLDAVWKTPQEQQQQQQEGGLDGAMGDKEDEDDDDEELVWEEECYAWTDLPMNKQGFRYIPCGPSPAPTVPLSSTASLAYPPFNRRIPALCMPFGKSEDSTSTTTSTKPPSSSRVHLDFLDRSMYLKISPSGLTCTAEKGFRSIRGNVGVRAGGGWYFECLVLKGGGEGKSAVRAPVEGSGGVQGKATRPVSERLGLRAGGSGDNGDDHLSPPTTTTTTTTTATTHVSTHNPIPTSATTSSSSDGAHIRLGWARREAPLNGPCGLDGYSYGIRDATGEKVTISRPKPYAGKGFGTGDVVGCLIYLPGDDDDQGPAAREREREGKGGAPKGDEFDPSVVARKRIPIRYKGQLYFESVEYTVPKEMEALVARDGRPVDPPVAVVSATSSATTNGAAGKQGNKRSVSDSPAKKKAASKATTSSSGGKGKQAGKAVRKKSAGSKRKRGNEDNDDCSEEDTAPKPRELPRIPGSKISFFLNGKPMASRPAFEDIFSFLPLRQTDAELATCAALSKKLGALEASLRDRENYNDDGTLGYYPFVSCFGGGKVQFHPGPGWMAPVDPTSWGLGSRVGEDGVEQPIIPRPLSERWQEYYAEEMVYDERDEKEVTELLKKEALSDAAKKRVKAEKSSTGKNSKASVAKRATMAAALQAASTPISRASSAVPSTNDSIPASSHAPSALLGTIIQDRGTPGGTPAPITPVEAQFDQTQMEDSRSSPPQTVTSASSLPPPSIPLDVDARDPYAIYQCDGTVLSATSEDAPGEDDWSQGPEPVDGEPLVVDDDAPELPYGMGTPPPPPQFGVGQIQERVVDHQQAMR